VKPSSKNGAAKNGTHTNGTAHPSLVTSPEKRPSALPGVVRRMTEALHGG
jgi:hypothetical protein